ncbi:botulinum neurotoxin transcription-activating sigma factor BotR [Clostridium sp. SHJSY1]|uniref:sigma-70 family RNA polymerase sigma factor n=1 Tax=Clostridium sp. SHJSY1 TaxID=2942483 RepID=UPI002877047C|nr:sigma-70 family RNA polymerase sigma factor [Clostridium sp. SHJSY1]MDS0527218.1 botulinum neurotoxin transcription-activating sigma factor BotR [Clostridium sp. SHJSY1]
MNLTELILCTNNKENFQDIYLKFKNRIDFLTKSFNLDLYQNDLILFLWQLIKKINLSDFKSEEALYSYIHISLKNYCINLYHKYHKNNKVTYNSILTNIEIDKNLSYTNIDNASFIFDELIVGLSDKQKKVITLRYKYCLSDTEIANSLNISRQAVYKNRIAALNKLHNTLCC